MVGIEQRVEGQLGHAACVVGSALQGGIDLPLQFVKLFRREGGLLQAAGQDAEQEVEVFGQGLSPKAGSVHASAEPQLCPHRFQ